MPKNCIRSLFYVGLIFSISSTLGCGKNDPKQLTQKAERDVDTFLDAWSRGEPADAFAGTDRPIQGTDPDWKEGHRLLSFLCDETKQSEEQPDRVRCRVALALQDKKGKKWERKVVYEVLLGEKTTIRRATP